MLGSDLSNEMSGGWSGSDVWIVMREGPVLRLAMEVALLASRGQPYLLALEQGVSAIFGVDTGIGSVKLEASGWIGFYPSGCLLLSAEEA